MSNSRTFQGLHKDSHSVFKDYNFMRKNASSTSDNLDRDNEPLSIRKLVQNCCAFI